MFGGSRVALVGPWFGMTYTDRGALRAIRRDAPLAIDGREAAYKWTADTQVRAARARLRVLDGPVPHGVRVARRSKAVGSVLGTVSASWRLVATVVRLGLQAAPTSRRMRR